MMGCPCLSGHDAHGFCCRVVSLNFKKLFKIFSKVLCDIFPARFRRFYRKIALLFSSKNDKNLARKPVSNVLRKNFKQLLNIFLGGLLLCVASRFY